MSDMIDYQQTQTIVNQVCYNSDLVRDAQIALIAEQNRPFVLLKPQMLYCRGKWQVCYGDVIVSGGTPDDASRKFDAAWKK